MKQTARILRRRLTWRLLAARKIVARRPGGTIGSLLGLPAALVLLLVMSPAGSLQFAPGSFRPSALGAVRAEAAPPRRQGAVQASRETTAASTSTSIASATGASATTNTTTATSDVAGDGDSLTPVAARFGAAQRSMPTPVATATAMPTATSSPTATPTATATATPNPYADDTLTDISRIPGWQNINWAAYVPTPVATAVPGVKGTGQFIMPTTGFISTQYVPTHLAIDIAGPLGSAVLAGDTGTVVFAGLDYGGYGYAVEIDHGNGFISAYGHNSVLKAKVGQIVRRGDLIALRGSTGHSTGPHVHFAIHKDGQAVDPFNYVIAGNPPAPVPQVAVPDLVGSSQANAGNALKGLTLQLVIDPPQPSNDVPPGKLAVQQPAAGSLADVNSAIHVSLSSGPPTPTPAPTATATPGVTAIPGRVETVSETGTVPAMTIPAHLTTSDTTTVSTSASTGTTTVAASPSPAATAVPTVATATSTPVASPKTLTATPIPHATATTTATAHR
jgi:murein DD-endopeptidase MepM/ murein hydrolase activator NlpD